MFERFYNARKDGGFAFGVHCWSADPGLYEICGCLGYDYVWIDNEHGGMTLPMVGAGIMATNASGCAAIVRVPGHSVEDVKPTLEFGPQGIVFPMVNTPEQAEICAKHCKYPPRGTRSYGPLRAADYGLQPLEEYLAEIDDKTLCFAQCEHIDSVNNLDAILEVPDIDVVICGSMDLSASMGKLGKVSDPEVVDAMNTIIRKCREKKKAFGLSGGVGMWALAKHWLENGAGFVSIGSAYDYFTIGSRDMIARADALR